MPLLVRTASLTKYSQIARSIGIDPVRTLRAAGVDPSCLSMPDLRIPEASLARVFEVSAHQGGGSLGVRIGEAWKLADFGALSLFLQHQPTLRDVLAQIECYRHLLSDSVAVHVEEIDDVAVLHVALLTGRPHPGPEMVELAVGAVFSLVRAMLGSNYLPRSVHFAHAAPASLEVHRRFFGQRVEFDSECDGIVLARQDLDRANPLADAHLAHYARELLDLQPRYQQESLADNVRRTLHILLPRGQGAIEPVSARLGLTPRTLQRQLEQTGMRFSALLNEVRASLAIRYLTQPRHSVSDVADLLGFSELSAFSRWFSGEFRQAPSHWRGAFFERGTNGSLAPYPANHSGH
ncbi:AraC-like DNA-binding protein [Paraburkholderia bannensis]|uniref:AraC-like DNA-binding protein n=1 Tax=Paraburkholderia bannensis TaxID=765414 RepID=A0A7W9U1T8_9BURK|nr:MULTISPECIES: AraC family transcriptional regulator [Paraburkholderia]MBB3259215.1 AraC-like DNA-binding protein [Paraburkholderia sp. WP4_3_2]MBB6104230.1 AraC-like DNA-binding protein [Paraburkholderia bannensis]